MDVQEEALAWSGPSEETMARAALMAIAALEQQAQQADAAAAAATAALATDDAEDAEDTEGAEDAEESEGTPRPPETEDLDSTSEGFWNGDFDLPVLSEDSEWEGGHTELHAAAGAEAAAADATEARHRSPLYVTDGDESIYSGETLPDEYADWLDALGRPPMDTSDSVELALVPQGRAHAFRSTSAASAAAVGDVRGALEQEERLQESRQQLENERRLAELEATSAMLRRALMMHRMERSLGLQAFD